MRRLLSGLVPHRGQPRTDGCIASRGNPAVMRVTTLKAGKAGLTGLVDYYAGLADDQLRRDGAGRGPVDYYLDPDEPPGRWWGRGCEAMELAGEVQPEQLAALLQARHPARGGRLGRSFGAKSARAFDATFSAPKSASLLWALSPDPWVRAEVLAAPRHGRGRRPRLVRAPRRPDPAREGRRRPGRHPGNGRSALPTAHQPQR